MYPTHLGQRMILKVTNDFKSAAVLTQVDQRRLDYTKNLFLQVGFAPFEAMVRARMTTLSSC